MNEIWTATIPQATAQAATAVELKLSSIDAASEWHICQVMKKYVV